MRVVQTRRPVGPVRLDRSNPLTAGLVDVFLPGLRVNLVSGAALAPTGSATNISITQVGVSAVSTSGGGAFHAASVLPAGVRVDEATLLTVVAPGSIGTATTSFYGFGSTAGSTPLMFIGQSGTAGDIYFFVRSDAGTAQNPTVTPPSGTWVAEQKAVLVGARSQSKNVHEMYVNGNRAASTTATTLGTTTLNSVAVGGLRRNTDGLVSAAKIALCLAWNRCLSAAEIKSISDNPWQIFEPIVVPVKTASSGVSGSGSPTNANDTSAGTGTTTVVGTSSTTNANDTSAGTGTTTVTGTVNYTNNNDTCAGSGTAGAITGTVNYTNNNDTAVGTGWAGIVTGTGSPTNANDTSTGEGTTPRARRGAAKPLRKGYIIRGKKYWLTDDELAIMVALELETIKRSDIKVPTKGRIKPIPTATFEMVRAVAKKLDELASIGLDDDEDEEEELLLML